MPHSTLTAASTSPLEVEILQYFSGERQEIYLILAGSALVIILVLLLWGTSRTSFAASFAATVCVFAALLSITATGLLIRDPNLQAQLVQSLHTPKQSTQIAAEQARIKNVIAKYPYYRYGAAFFAFIALMSLVLSHRPWMHGLAAGLLLLVVVQVIIDNYSEHRARGYLMQLSRLSV